MGNLFAKVFRSREVRVLLCGLYAAGKTTLLYRIKLGEVIPCIPTLVFNVETVQHRDLNLTVWDTGIRCGLRPLLSHFYKGVDAVVVVLDRNNKKRVDEIYQYILQPIYQAENLQKSVLLFLANKSDLDDTMSLEEIKGKLNINQIKDRTFNIFSVSAVSGEGIPEAMDWLAAELGSVEARRALTGPQEKDNQKLFDGFNPCSIAFSSLKWLFSKSNNSYADIESPDDPQEPVSVSTQS